MEVDESGTIRLEMRTWAKIKLYVEKLLENIPDFTGKLEINFKDGKLMDINETKRTKF